jgi:hypothetical protein
MSNSSDFWYDFFDSSTYYTGPLLTDSMVSSVERDLGYRLPQSYLQLLRVKNGGAPKRQCHPTSGSGWSDNHVRVTSIFGIGGRWGIDSKELGTKHMIQEAGFPEIGVIIGWTPTAGHDAVMLDYSACGAQGEPRVVHIDAESGESQILAINFETFALGLVDCRPYEELRERAMEEFRRRKRD